MIDSDTRFSTGLGYPLDYVRRPRVGDRVATRYGTARVSHVYRNGLVLDVVDRLDRTWTVQRSPVGWWVRVPVSLVHPTRACSHRLVPGQLVCIPCETARAA